ncbi:MAG: hypothetical protein WC789_09795 [Lentisphaeria bacterium]
MSEKQVIISPETAENIRGRLVDPRNIESIVFVASSDDSPIRGFPEQDTIAISMWGTLINQTCFKILNQLPLPPYYVHMESGKAAVIAGGYVTSLIANRPSDKSKMLIFLQPRKVLQNPPGYCFPKEFSLITICSNPKGAEHDVRILEEDDILPECDITGNELFEFRNQKKLWWMFWK